MNTPIVPTVGRVVYVFEGRDVPPLAGLVTAVFDDPDIITVSVFPPGGGVASFRELQWGGPDVDAITWDWMPYQVAQAKAAAVVDTAALEPGAETADPNPSQGAQGVQTGATGAAT